MGEMILYTERLILRPWEESDAESLYIYASDDRVGYPAGWPAHRNVEDSLEIIRTVLSDPNIYAVCRKGENRAIGSVGLKTGRNTFLTDRADEAEIGYWLGVPFWGRGYIPEAVRELQRHCFEDLKMRGLWCAYYEGNEKSRRVQEKSGFKYHHTMAGTEVSLLNEIRTEHVYYLSREEWEKNREVPYAQ